MIPERPELTLGKYKLKPIILDESKLAPDYQKKKEEQNKGKLLPYRLNPLKLAETREQRKHDEHTLITSGKVKSNDSEEDKPEEIAPTVHTAKDATLPPEKPKEKGVVLHKQPDLKFDPMLGYRKSGMPPEYSGSPFDGNQISTNLPDDKEHLDWTKDTTEETDPDMDDVLKRNIQVGYELGGSIDDETGGFADLKIDLSNLDNASKELDRLYMAKLEKMGIARGTDKYNSMLATSTHADMGPLGYLSGTPGTGLALLTSATQHFKDAMPMWEDGPDLLSKTLHKFSSMVLGYEFTDEEAKLQKDYLKAKDYINGLKAYKKVYNTDSYTIGSNRAKSPQEAIAYGLATGFYNYFNQPLKRLMYGKTGEGATPIEMATPYIRDAITTRTVREMVITEGMQRMGIQDPDEVHHIMNQLVEENKANVVEDIAKGAGELTAALCPIGGFGIANKITQGITLLGKGIKETEIAKKVGKLLFAGEDVATLKKIEKINEVTQELTRDFRWMKKFKSFPTTQKAEHLFKYIFNPKMDMGAISTEGKIIRSIHNSFGSTLHGVKHMVVGSFVDHMLQLDPTMTTDQLHEALQDMAILGVVNGSFGRMLAKSARARAILAKGFSTKFPTQKALDSYLAMTDKVSYTMSMLPATLSINMFKDFVDNAKIDFPMQVYMSDIVTSMLFGFGDFKYLAQERGRYKAHMDYIKKASPELGYEPIRLRDNINTKEIPMIDAEEFAYSQPKYVSDYDFVKSYSNMEAPLTVDNLVNSSLGVAMSGLTAKERTVLKDLAVKYGDMAIEPKDLEGKYYAEISPENNVMYLDNKSGYFNDKYHDPRHIGKFLIHELAHKETSERYNTDKKFAEGVFNLRQYVKNNIPESVMDAIVSNPTDYAMFEEMGLVMPEDINSKDRIKHDKEFMAYLFGNNNSRFIRLLKDTKMSDYKGESSLLDQIKNFFYPNSVYKVATDYVLNSEAQEDMVRNLADDMDRARSILQPIDETNPESLHISREVLATNLDMDITASEYESLFRTVKALERDNPGFVIDPYAVYRDYVERVGYKPTAKQLIDKVKEDVQAYREKVTSNITPIDNLYEWMKTFGDETVKVSGDKEGIHNDPQQAEADRIENEGSPPELDNGGMILDKSNMEYLYDKLGYKSAGTMYKELKGLNLPDLYKAIRNKMPEEVAAKFKSGVEWQDFLARIHTIINNHVEVTPATVIVNNGGEDTIFGATTSPIRHPLPQHKQMEGDLTFLKKNLDAMLGERGFIKKNGLSMNTARIAGALFGKGQSYFPQDILLERYAMNGKDLSRRVSTLKDVNNYKKIHKIKKALLEHGVFILPGKNQGYYTQELASIMKSPQRQNIVRGMAKEIHDAILRTTLQSRIIWDGKYRTETIKKVIDLLDMDYIREILKSHAVAIGEGSKYTGRDIKEALKLNRDNTPTGKQRLQKVVEHIEANKEVYNDIYNTILDNASKYYMGPDIAKLGEHDIPFYLEQTDKPLSKEDLVTALYTELVSLYASTIDPAGKTRIPKVEELENGKIKVQYSKFFEKYVNASMNKSLLQFRNTEDFLRLVPTVRDIFIKGKSGKAPIKDMTEAERNEAIDKGLKGTGHVRIGNNIYHTGVFVDPRWFSADIDVNPEAISEGIKRLRLSKDINDEAFDSATVLLNGAEIANNIFGTNIDETKVFKTFYHNVDHHGSLMWKHAEFVYDRDEFNKEATDFDILMDKLKNADLGFISSADGAKMGSLLNDPIPVYIPKYEAYVGFDRLGHPVEAFKDKENPVNDEELLNNIVQDIGKQVLETGVVPSYVKVHIPVTGEGAKVYMQAGHPSKRHVEYQGGANGVTDAIQIIKDSQIFADDEVSKMFPEMSGEKAFAGFDELSNNVIRRGRENLAESIALFNVLSKVVKGVAVTDLEKRIEHDVTKAVPDLERTELQYAAAGMKRLAEFLRRSDEEIVSKMYPFVKLFGKEKAIEEMESAIIGDPDSGEAILDVQKAYYLLTAFKGMFMKNKFAGHAEGTLFMSMIKDDYENMTKQRTSGAYTTLAPAAFGNKSSSNRLIAHELNSYRERLQKKVLAGRISQVEAEEKALRKKEALEARLEWLHSPEAGIFDSDGRLADGGNGVILSKYEYDLLKHQARKNGYEFGVGSRVFVKRTPVDSMDSMGAFFVAGIVDGAGISIINRKTSAKVFGTDYDKDGIQIMIPDKVYTKDIFDQHHEFWLRTGINSGILKADAGVQADYTTIYDKMTGKNEEFQHLLGETGLEETKRAHQPQHIQHAEWGEETDANIGAAINARSAIRNFFRNTHTKRVTGEDGKEYVEAVVKFGMGKDELNPELIFGTDIHTGRNKFYSADLRKLTNESVFDQRYFARFLESVTFRIPAYWETRDGVKYDKASSMFNEIIQASVDSYNQRSYNPVRALFRSIVHDIKFSEGQKLGIDKKDNYGATIYAEIGRAIVEQLSGTKVKNLVRDGKSFESMDKVVQDLKDSLTIKDILLKHPEKVNASPNSHYIKALGLYSKFSSNAAYHDPTHNKSFEVLMREGNKHAIHTLRAREDFGTSFNYIVKKLGVPNEVYYELMGGKKYEKGVPKEQWKREPGVNFAVMSLLAKVTNATASRTTYGDYLASHKTRREVPDLWNKSVYYDPESGKRTNLFEWLSYDDRVAGFYKKETFKRAVGTFFHRMIQKYSFAEGMETAAPLTGRLPKRDDPNVLEFFTYKDGKIHRWERGKDKKWKMKEQIHIKSLFNPDGTTNAKWIRPEVFGIKTKEGNPTLLKAKREDKIGTGTPFRTTEEDPLLKRYVFKLQDMIVTDAPVTERELLKLSHDVVANALRSIPNLTPKQINALYTDFGFLKSTTKTNAVWNGYGASAESSPLMRQLYLEPVPRDKNAELAPLSKKLFSEIERIEGFSYGAYTRKNYLDAVKKYSHIAKFLQHDPRNNIYDILAVAKEDGIEPTLGATNGGKVIDFLNETLKKYGEERIPSNDPPVAEEMKGEDGEGLHMLRSILHHDNYKRTKDELRNGKAESDLRKAFYSIGKREGVSEEIRKRVDNLLKSKTLDRMNTDDYALLFEHLLKPQLKSQAKSLAEKKKLFKKAYTPEEKKAIFEEADAILDAISPNMVTQLNAHLSEEGVDGLGLLAVKSVLLYKATDALMKFEKDLRKEVKGKKKILQTILNPFKSQIPSSLYKNAHPIMENYAPDYKISKTSTWVNGKPVPNTEASYYVTDTIEHETGVQQLFTRLPKHEVEIFQWFNVLDDTKNRLSAILNIAEKEMLFGEPDTETGNIIGLHNAVSAMPGIANIEKRFKDLTGGVELFKGENPLISIISSTDISGESSKVELRTASGTVTYNIKDNKELDDFINRLINLDVVKQSRMAVTGSKFTAEDITAIKNIIRAKNILNHTVNIFGMLREQVSHFKDMHFSSDNDKINKKIDQVLSDFDRYMDMYGKGDVESVVRLMRDNNKPIKEILDAVEENVIVTSNRRIQQYIKVLDKNKKWNDLKANIKTSRLDFKYNLTQKEKDARTEEVKKYKEEKKKKEEAAQARLNEKKAKEKESEQTLSPEEQVLPPEDDFMPPEELGSYDDIPMAPPEEMDYEAADLPPELPLDIKRKAARKVTKVPPPSLQKLLVSTLKKAMRENINTPEEIDIHSPGGVLNTMRWLRQSEPVKYMEKRLSAMEKRKKLPFGYKNKESLLSDMFKDVIEEVRVEKDYSGAYYEILRKIMPDKFKLPWGYLEPQQKKSMDILARDIIQNVIHRTIENENIQDQINDISNTLDGDAELMHRMKEKSELLEKVDIHDLLLASRPRLASDPNWYSYSMSNMNENLTRIAKNMLINMSHVAYDVYSRKPDTDLFTQHIALGRIGEMFGNKSIYNKAIRTKDVPHLEVGTPLRVTYKTATDELRTIVGYNGGIVKRKVEGDPESGEPTSIPVLAVLDFKRSDAGKNIVSIIPQSRLVDVTAGHNPTSQRYENAVKESLKADINDLVQSVSDYTNEQATASKVSNAIKVIRRNIEASNAAKMARIQSRIVGTASAMYYLGGIPIATFGTGLAATAAGFAGLINPAIGGTMLATGAFGLIRRFGAVFVRNIIGTAGFVGGAPTEKKYGTGLMGYTIGGIAKQYKAVIDYIRHAYPAATESRVAGALMALLNQSDTNSAQSVQSLELGLGITGMAPKDAKERLEFIKGTSLFQKLKSKIDEITPRRATKKLSEELENGTLNAESMNTLYRKMVYDDGEVTSQIREEIAHQLDEYTIDEIDRSIYMQETLKRNGGKWDADKNKKVYSDLDRLDKVLLTHNGLSRREIEALRPYLFDRIVNGLSLDGAVQRMEIDATKGAMVINNTYINEIKARRNEAIKKLKSKGHLQDLSSSVDVSPYLVRNWENSMLWKAIGNYQKTIYHKTPTMSIMNMFGNFTKERFLNNTVYLNERKKMYKYIKDQLAESEGFQEAMKELDGLGIAIGGTVLQDVNKQLSRLAIGGAGIFLLTEGVGYLFKLLGLDFLVDMANSKIDGITSDIVTLGYEPALMLYSGASALIAALTMEKRGDKKGTGRIEGLTRKAITGSGTGLLTSQLAETLGVLGMFAAAEIGSKVLKGKHKRTKPTMGFSAGGSLLPKKRHHVKTRSDYFWDLVSQQIFNTANTLSGGVLIAPYTLQNEVPVTEWGKGGKLWEQKKKRRKKPNF